MDTVDSIRQMIGFAELKVGFAELKVDFAELKVYEVRGVKVMFDATVKILRSNFLTSKNLYIFKSSFLRN